MSLFRREPSTTSERLRELLAENLPRSARRADWQPATTLRELGVNSLGLVLLMTRFCEEFEIRMETVDGNLGELRTVGDLLAAGERIVERQSATTGSGASAGG
jgi:acyl carrier protein